MFHIIGSGPSLDSYKQSNDEIENTICIDQSYKDFSSKYIITRYHYLLHDALSTGRIVLTSELDFSKNGFHKKLILINPISNLITYKSDIKTKSVIIDAIDLAVQFGSHSIILHGIDYPFRSGAYAKYQGNVSEEDMKYDYPEILRKVFELINQGIDISFHGISKEMIEPYAKRILKNETRINKSLLQVL